MQDIRGEVFIAEQHVPPELEWDGEDPGALHLLAEDTDGQPIGTGRMLPNGHIGRMCVLPEHRRRGVGSALLAGLLHRAGSDGYPTPYLNAQVTAVAFYTRHGFLAVGEVFTEAGIPHRRMEYRGVPAASVGHPPGS